MARKTVVFLRDIHSQWKQYVLCTVTVTWVIQVVVLLFSQLDDWRDMVAIVLEGLPREDIRRHELAQLTKDDSYDFVRFCQQRISPNRDILVLDYTWDMTRRAVFRYYLDPVSSFYYLSTPWPDSASLHDLIANSGIDYVIVNMDLHHRVLFSGIPVVDRHHFDGQRSLAVIGGPTMEGSP